jgi:hypothetical protein
MLEGGSRNSISIRTEGPASRFYCHLNRVKACALDSLQLAVALDLRKRGAIDTVISADSRFLAAARAEGMPVINPEEP